MMADFAVIRWVDGSFWLVTVSERGYYPLRQFASAVFRSVYRDHFWKVGLGATRSLPSCAYARSSE